MPKPYASSPDRKLIEHGLYSHQTPLASPDRWWPGGKKLAVYVALGFEAYDFGSGLTENLLDGAAHPDLANTSWRDYGNRVGGFKLLELLKDNGIVPTILLNTAVYAETPQLTAAARSQGAEFVGHGVSNSDTLAGLSVEDEKDYLTAVAQRIRKEEGRAPLGWSSPWLAQNRSTLASLKDVGYRYVLDLRFDDRPVWLTAGDSTLLSVPYALELNDSTSMIGRKVGPREFADMIVDEFDMLCADAQDRPLVMSLVLHSFISGVPFRRKPLMAALKHLASRPDVAWFTTPGGIFQAVEHSRPELGR